MCDTVVRVDEGRVLFAKNSDRDPNEAQLLEWRPAATHHDGGEVRCTDIAIPQASETRAVLFSRPFWMWGAEMGANDAGVVIGNEAVFTTEPYAEVGLLGMDLLRLGLERSTTAVEAVEVMTALLEQHGQGGGHGHERRHFTYHNSYLVADAGQAIVLESAGRKWDTEVVTAGVRSISNGLTIPAFADRHADGSADRYTSCRVRQQVTAAGAAEVDGPLGMMALLRRHEDDGVAPTYHEENGAMGGPCMHAGGTVAASQTTSSWVSELTPTAARHWATGTAAPCTSLFVPVAVDEPVDLGSLPTDAHDPHTLWWRHELLHRTVMRDPERLLALYADERDAVERRWVERPPSAAEAWAEADRERQAWNEGVRSQWRQDPVDMRPAPVQQYWTVRNERAGVPVRT